jgi:hypothetical protein
VDLKFYPGQPQKIIAIAPPFFSACTLQNFEDWGRGSGGGLPLRRDLKETPTDPWHFQEFFQELNCYGKDPVILLEPGEPCYFLTMVSRVAKGHLICLGTLIVKMRIMLPGNADGTHNLDAFCRDRHVGL